MEKEKLISKLNIKDYNNQLEKILSKKTFSEDTKNLLLSMLYKIENSYEDYILVNGETKTKKETLEEILKIIENECDEIEIVNTKDSRVEENKIITYLNVRKMLYEIYQIDSRKFNVFDEYEIIKFAMEETLNQGNSISSSEVIRDFDGWSWNIAVQEIENLKANLVYQTLKILVGQKLLDEWKNNKEEDYMAKLMNTLENKYKTEIAEKALKLVTQIAILNIVKSNEEQKNILIQKQDELQKEFEQMDNKKEYLTNLGEKKKKIVEEIKAIDNILNSDRNLKQEFITRNELLDMNHRIFSLSDLADILEKERNKHIKELDICSKKMEPLNFIKTKTEIENQLLLLKEIDIQSVDEKTYNVKVKELIKLVFKAMTMQVNNTDEKNALIRLIYKIRYYSLIYVNQDKQVKDIVDVNVLQRLIITKACKQRVVTIFSKNIKENYEIVKNILQTDIIELEKMYFKFIKEKGSILLEIYDEENPYKTIKFENIEELNVKLNKKIKVFI